MSVACAAGGGVGRHPCTPGQGFAPGPQNDVIAWRNVRRGWLSAVWMQDHMIQVSAQRSHESMLFSCTKHQMQGVWGRATPPMGSARGGARSHLRSNISCGWKRQTSIAGVWSNRPTQQGRQRQSPLAFAKQHIMRLEAGLWGHRPLSGGAGAEPARIYAAMHQQRGDRPNVCK